MKETFKRAGYSYIKYLGDGDHLLKNSDGQNEVFHSNKNNAGWGLVFKNTHLEFCRSLHNDECVLKS